MRSSEWGPAVWLLFHMIAEKIDADYVRNNSQLLVQFIQQVCSNLPCPNCSEHAQKVLQSAKLYNIQEKEQLKYFFWSFHNIVNTKLGLKIFNYESLQIYKNSVPRNVIINFKNKFGKRIYNERLLMENFRFNNTKYRINNFLDNLLINGHLNS